MNMQNKSFSSHSFSNNNSSVEYDLKFMMPEEHQQIIGYTLSKEMVYHVLLQQLFDQDTGDPLYIEPNSLTMEGNHRHNLTCGYITTTFEYAQFCLVILHNFVC